MFFEFRKVGTLLRPRTVALRERRWGTFRISQFLAFWFANAHQESGMRIPPKIEWRLPRYVLEFGGGALLRPEDGAPR